MNVKFYRYTVEGTGIFPFDMLRYDSCWPNSESEVVRLAHPYRGTPEQMRDFTTTKRQINLTGVGEPTTERWRSFGWHVIPESVRRTA